MMGEGVNLELDRCWRGINQSGAHFEAGSMSMDYGLFHTYSIMICHTIVKGWMSYGMVDFTSLLAEFYFDIQV